MSKKIFSEILRQSLVVFLMVVAGFASAAADYPGAAWAAAYPYNCGDSSRGGANNYPSDCPGGSFAATNIQYIVVHAFGGDPVTRPGYAATVSYLQTLGRSASAHYVIGNGGQITQMVHHEDVAYQAGNLDFNRISIGIEHDDSSAGNYLLANWSTELMYQASANLVTYLTNLYNIPKDRLHIIGHNQVPREDNPASCPFIGPVVKLLYVAGGCNYGGLYDKRDPGVYWDWNHYMSLISGGTATVPTVTTIAATPITSTSATLNATIPNDGGASIVERRFEWSPAVNGVLFQRYVSAGVGNNFSYVLSGLTPNTTYQYRAWAGNSSTQVVCGTAAGWGCGGWVSFTTPGVVSQLPDIVVTNISPLPASVQPGFTLPFAAFVQNIGPADSGPFSMSYYLSTSPTLTSAAIPILGTADCGTFPNLSYLGRWSTQCWADVSMIPTGNYYLIVDANPQHLITESDYTNNAVVTSSTVQITAAPPTTRVMALSGNLAFGSVAVNGTATAQLTISNSGNSALTVSSIAYPAGFSGAWSGTVAAGGSQPVTVTFAPTAATSYGGTITVTANQTSGTSTISASGTGAVTPTRVIALGGNLAFGSVAVNVTATAQLTISNSGNSALTVSSIAYPAGFSGAWSGTVAAGGSQPVTVTFAPTAATSYSGTITVTANQTSGTSTISASGTGAATTNVFPPNCQLPSGWTVPSGANAGWTVATDFASEGTCSLKSAPILNSQNAQIQFVGTLGAGNVTFSRKVSSETSWDCFRFYVDGVAQDTGGLGQLCGIGQNSTIMGASGDVPWGAMSFPIAAGVHTLLWSYEKDTSNGFNQDAAWIDAVVLPAAVPTVAATLTSPIPGTTLTGSSANFAWSAGSGVSQYWLEVGTTYMGAELYSQDQGTNLSTTVMGLPTNGQPLSVTLYSVIAGLWHYHVYTYTAAASAVPALTFTPSSLNFPNQNVGTNGPVQTLTVTNTGTGNAVLNFGNISVSGDFLLTNGCTSSLAIGFSCNLSLQFAPTGAGTRSGSVSVGSNAASSPNTMFLSGVGLAGPVCSLIAAPTSVRKNGSTTLTASCTPAANTYSWTGGACVGKTTPTCTDSPAATTTYWVTGSNGSNVSNPVSAVVTVKPVDLTPILMLLLD